MMQSYAIWHSRPVFVTSTFRDMHAERDYLHNHVFPELEERLRERFHHLEPIDLRWGVETVTVDEQRAKELLVLKVCLAEIERSRPFLIALLGDRYGWVPPRERMEAAAQEAGYQADLSGKSVTALEIEFGVLDSPEQRRRSRFYFREPLPYDEMDPSTAALFSEAHSSEPGAQEAHARLAALKARIERQMPDRVRRYHAAWDAAQQSVTGLEEWGRQVLEDLWHDLDEETRQYLHLPPATWQDQERWALEQFIETRCRDFIGRQETVDKLMRLASSPAVEGTTWGACVVGVSGSGKSSLFAQLCRLLRDEEVLVLAHAAGISTRSSQVEAPLRRWTQELAEFLEIPDPSAELTAREDLEREFARLLGLASQRRRVVCLLDALNQFERTPSAQHLTWLPKLWPENARLIATTLPGSESEALERRPGVEVVALPLLDQHEAEQIALAICRRYHKALHPEILQALVSKRLPDGSPAAGIPLWLELALEELLLLDADDFARAEREFTGRPEQRLHAMMLDLAERLPPDVESLYAYLLQRTEEVHGERWARGFANLIAVTRGGLRESDFQALLPQQAEQAWDPLRFAGLRRGFRAHLVQRGAHGQWDFFHAQMRAAVERRNLADPEQRRWLHMVIADHLETLSREDPVRQTELMFHYIGADDKPRAARHYGDPSCSDAEVNYATQALAEYISGSVPPTKGFAVQFAKVDESTGDIVDRTAIGPWRQMTPGLEWVLSLADVAGLTDEAVQCMCWRLQTHLEQAMSGNTPLSVQLPLLEKVGQLISASAVANHPSAAWLRYQCEFTRGNVMRGQGNYDGAIEAYQNSLNVLTSLRNANPRDAEVQRCLCIVLQGLGSLLQRKGDWPSAEERCSECTLIAAELCRNDDSYEPLLCSCLFATAVFFHKTQRLDESLGMFRSAAERLEALCGQDRENSKLHSSLCSCYANISGILLEKGDVAEATRRIRATEAICERFLHCDPTSVRWRQLLASALNMLAGAQMQAGDLAAAFGSCSKAVALTDSLVTKDPGDVYSANLAATCRKNVIAVLHTGAKTQPEIVSPTHLELMSALCAQERSQGSMLKLIECWGFYGRRLLGQGDADGAAEYHRRSVGLIDVLRESRPEDDELQDALYRTHLDWAVAYAKQGSAGRSIDLFERALQVARQLRDRNPADVAWTHRSAGILGLLGEVCWHEGDVPRAIECFRAELSERHRILADCPTDEAQAQCIWICHNKIGDVLLSQGDISGALGQYREALAIAERLGAALDPNQTQWQRDLVVSYYKLATAHEQAGDDSRSQRYRGDCRETLRRMKESGMFLDPALVGLLEQLEKAG